MPIGLKEAQRAIEINSRETETVFLLGQPNDSRGLTLLTSSDIKS